MPLNASQVVPWASAFVGSTSAAWLASKLSPKKYRKLLAGLGLLGGGALGYYLGGRLGSSFTPGGTDTTPAATAPQNGASAPSWSDKLSDTAKKAVEYVWNSTPGRLYRAGWSGTLRGLEDAYKDAYKDTKENGILSDIPKKTLWGAQLAELLGWLPKKVTDKIPALKAFKPGSPYGKAVRRLGWATDFGQALANTYLDIKRGFSDTYFGDKALAYSEQVLDNTDFNILETALHNIKRNIAEKALRTTAFGLLVKSRSGVFGASQAKYPVPMFSLPLGETIGYTREMLRHANPGNEEALQLKVLNRALFHDHARKPGESFPETTWRELKNTLRGGLKLISGAYGKDIYNAPMEEESVVAKRMDSSDLAEAKKQLTEQVLAADPTLAADYNSNDGMRRLRAIQTINKQLAPGLNKRYTFKSWL